MSRTRASSSRDAPGTRSSRGPTPTSYCDDTADDDLPQAPRAAPRSGWSKRPRAPPAGGDDEDGQGRRRPRHEERRHLHRRNLESHAQSNCAVGEAFLYGYLSELYTSPRHASVDPAYRHAVVVHVLQYYAEHLAQHEELPEDDPPFLSRQRRASSWSTRLRFVEGDVPSTVCVGGNSFLGVEMDGPGRPVGTARLYA